MRQSRILGATSLLEERPTALRSQRRPGREFEESQKSECQKEEVVIGVDYLRSLEKQISDAKKK